MSFVCGVIWKKISPFTSQIYKFSASNLNVFFWEFRVMHSVFTKFGFLVQKYLGFVYFLSNVVEYAIRLCLIIIFNQNDIFPKIGSFSSLTGFIFLRLQWVLFTFMHFLFNNIVVYIIVIELLLTNDECCL